MPNTLCYIEAAAKRHHPDSPEFHDLMREYARELNREWLSGPLSGSDACDHDKKRNYPARFSAYRLPGNGTKAWQALARRVGVQPSLIDEAPARVELSHMADETIPKQLTQTKHDRDTMIDVFVRQSLRDPHAYSSQFDRALEHLRAIVRRARELGFYPADTDQKSIAA